ncbi:Polynucleotide 5'-hydroxyl-kinase NOL9 [Ophiophagus hannah]|uniref:Polynucleotide 5'-hydroxyl-kinase NOL9 n=1 Tax=Ophiophagus hannah TaxID=8665 RepID=V8NIV3_OPHHA|nr:Polynucleotide 5'-hydroxyl-kinase NOL9 [Ophiophagus hannah]
MKVEARALLRAHFVPQEARGRLLKSFGPDCSLLLLEQLDTPEAKFILSHPEFSQIFRAKKQDAPPFIPEDTVLASAGLGRLEPSSGLLVSQSMHSAIGELIHACQVEDEGCPVILVCGPKSIGKSTFNRYLMNLLLNRLPCLEYLECDLGQPEFNPPGCISLVDVREPLLGPPFSHQRPPRKMAFYGDISCEHDTERYLDTLKYVLGGYERDVPLLINTMGWVKGQREIESFHIVIIRWGRLAGLLLLLIDVIRLLLPTHVVQLSAEDFKELPLLSADYIRTTAGLHTRGKPSLKRKHPGGSWQGTHTPQPGHQLLCVQANFPGAGVPGIGAVALKVIHVDVAPTHILCSLNASWVGLCHLPDRVP